MAKFNTGRNRPAGSGPMISSSSPTLRTHEGAPAHERDDKSALFLLAVSNMVGEGTFYESADARDERYRDLIRRVAASDPIWLYNMLVWLRQNGNMRSASLVGAAEFVRARRLADPIMVPTDPSRTTAARGLLRAVVDEVCQRADEPGEMLAYWTGRYGRAIPKPIKRGLSDACQRLYTERSLLKYDTPTRGGGGGFRFGDVIELVHAKPIEYSPSQSRLYRLAIERRQDRRISYHELAGTLNTVWANSQVRAQAANGNPSVLLDAGTLRTAGMTWEDALSLVGSKVDKAKLWEALIPSMGYMALLRNLRNFDQSGISRTAAREVEDRLADPAQVARSRQLPFRFYSAYRAVSSVNWMRALEDALDLSVQNVPKLLGRTLVLVDTSGSMTSRISERSSVSNGEVAALFGAVLAVRNPGRVNLHGFATGQFHHPVRRGSSILRTVEEFRRRNGEVGHGTDVASALRETYRGHDRVIVISDEQTHFSGNAYFGRSNSVTDQIPQTIPMYAFNLGGYRPGMMATGGETPNRHQLGGLTDHTFRLIPLIEQGKRGGWPWEQE